MEGFFQPISQGTVTASFNDDVPCCVELPAKGDTLMIQNMSGSRPAFFELGGATVEANEEWSCPIAPNSLMEIARAPSQTHISFTQAVGGTTGITCVITAGYLR